MRKLVLVLIGCVLVGAGIGAYFEPQGNASELPAASRVTAPKAQMHSSSASLPGYSRARTSWPQPASTSLLSTHSDDAVPASDSTARPISFTHSGVANVVAATAFPASASHSMPTSGSEPEYFPQAWNNPFIGPGNNCYAYACDDPSDWRMNDCDFPQPGSTAGATPCDRSEFTVELLRQRAISDGLAPVPHGRDESAPPDGFYKVALFVDPGKDYHWYRQDDNGNWSHKLGDGPVMNLDGAGNPIADPRAASNNYENHFDPVTGRPIGGYNYTQFGGFFYVPEGGIRLRSAHG